MNVVVGDKVGVDDPKYPGVWTVKSIARVNVTLQPENGGRALRAPMFMLTPADAAPAAAAPTVYYDAGELIRIDSGKYAGLWVVIADKAGDRVNLAKLGGDNGRYLRMPRRGLVKVDPQDVLKVGN